MSQILAKLENLELIYDSDHDLIEAVWNGFISGDVLKSAVLTCIQLLEEKKPKNWLADNRKLKALRMKDQEWLAENLVPKLADSSIKKMATLISEDIFNQMAIENLYTKASETVKFEHKYFKSLAEARSWLLGE